MRPAEQQQMESQYCTHTHTECHVANAIIVSQGTESTVALLHNAHLGSPLGMLYLFPKAANYSHLSDHEERGTA